MRCATLLLLAACLVVFGTWGKAHAGKSLTPDQLKQIQEQISQCAKESIEKSGLDVSPSCYIDCKLTGWPPKLECKLKC